MHSSELHALLVALSVMLGVIVALVTGILSKVGGASLPKAAMHSGAAFGGTVTLALMTMRSLGLLD